MKTQWNQVTDYEIIDVHIMPTFYKKQQTTEYVPLVAEFPQPTSKIF